MPTKPMSVTPPIQLNQAPEVHEDLYAHLGKTGFENVTQQDLGMPFLVICQKGSPEFDASHPQAESKGIPGIVPGAVFNTLSREVHYMPGEDPIKIIPISWEQLFVEWKSRTQGGGIVQIHRNANIMENTTKDVTGRDALPNGNNIVKTSYFYCAIYGRLNDPVVIGMSSTQQKQARNWLNLAWSAHVLVNGQRVRPPLFGYTYDLSTFPESNNKGSWHSWRVSISHPVTSIDEIQQLAQMAKTVTENRVASQLLTNNDQDDVL